MTLKIHNITLDLLTSVVSGYFISTNATTKPLKGSPLSTRTISHVTYKNLLVYPMTLNGMKRHVKKIELMKLIIDLFFYEKGVN